MEKSTLTANWLPGAVTAVSAITVYLLTTPPDLTLTNFGGDGGELIAAAVTLGVPHPPGYPTYVIIGKLISLLPLGTIAYRFHLLSAISAALAAGLVADLLRREVRSVTAVSTALALAFSFLVWGQAIIAEIYAPALLLISLVVWCRYTHKPSWLTGLLWGLSLTMHLTAVFLLPIIVAGNRKRPYWTPFLIGIGTGSLPWLLLPLLARQNSPIIWGNPTSLSGWWWLVSAEIYRANLFGLPVNEWLPRLQTWLPILSTQFTLASVPLLAATFFQPARPTPVPRWAIRLTPFLFLLYSFFYNTSDALVFTLPLWLFVSILLAPVLSQFGRLALLLPLTLLLLNFTHYHSQRDQTPRPTVINLLAEAPTGAVLITPGDESTFVLWYFHHVEQVRPDVALLDSSLAGYDWYRQRWIQQHPDIDLPASFLEENLELGNWGKRPFCTIALSPPAINCPPAQSP